MLETLKCDSHCYCSDDGEEFSIAVFDGTNMKFGVDTEDAEVESVDIQGEEGIMVKLARCCNPIPGDPVIGYITRGSGV